MTWSPASEVHDGLLLMRPRFHAFDVLHPGEETLIDYPCRCCARPGPNSAPTRPASHNSYRLPCLPVYRLGRTHASNVCSNCWVCCGTVESMTDDLFAAMGAPDHVTRPLAVRMRPSERRRCGGAITGIGGGVAIAQHANPASKGSLTAPSSIILFGPPESANTLAYIVAKQSGRVLEELSAVTSGVKDVRDVLKRAHERSRLRRQGNGVVHRRGAPLLQIAAGRV